MKGKLFAISGPSGVGKNSVLNCVMQLRDRVQYSVSATSRPMRPGEIDGKSYYFDPADADIRTGDYVIVETALSIHSISLV